MSLREHKQEIEIHIEWDLEHLDDPVSLAKVGPLYERLSTNLRVIGGCALLLDGDTDGLYAGLTRSGHAHAHLLARRAKEPAVRSPHLATGNSAAFFDTLAARNFDLARHIASLSPTEWWRGEEYEEDFCFASFFHLLLQASAPVRDVLTRTLDRFGEAAGDDDKAKLLVCQALAARDQKAFDEGFDALLDSRAETLKEDKERFWPDGQIVYRVNSRLYIEGLAILNVADMLGLATADEYRYCPRLARLPATKGFPANLWAS
jgi:hypothetical protein